MGKRIKVLEAELELLRVRLELKESVISSLRAEITGYKRVIEILKAKRNE